MFVSAAAAILNAIISFTQKMFDIIKMVMLTPFRLSTFELE